MWQQGTSVFISYDEVIVDNYCRTDCGFISERNELITITSFFTIKQP
jgi:hypothetical protein